MLASKITKPQARTANPTNCLTSNCSTLGHRLGHGSVEQAFLPEQVSTLKNSMTREAPRGVSWNFNKSLCFHLTGRADPNSHPLRPNSFSQSSWSGTSTIRWSMRQTALPIR